MEENRKNKIDEENIVDAKIVEEVPDQETPAAEEKVDDTPKTDEKEKKEDEKPAKKGFFGTLKEKASAGAKKAPAAGKAVLKTLGKIAIIGGGVVVGVFGAGFLAGMGEKLSKEDEPEGEEKVDEEETLETPVEESEEKKTEAEENDQEDQIGADDDVIDEIDVELEDF